MKETILPAAAWLVAAAVSAYACHLAAIHATPIDRALPFIAVVIVFSSERWRPRRLSGRRPGASPSPEGRRDAARSAGGTPALLGLPLLILAEITIPDETLRLLAFGTIAAAAIVAASFESPVAAAIASILLLRWIPFEDVHIGRELLLLAIAVAIVYTLGRTPFAVAVAVIAALVTPAVPLRTLALPLLVLFVAWVARVFGMPRLRLALPSAIAMAFVLLFFAWSGIVARAFPYFLKRAQPPAKRLIVNHALERSQSTRLRVPDGARALIVSGANVPHFRPGFVLGTIEPGGAAVTIGDTADWGYMRRDHYYVTRNPLPRDPAGKIRGYGYTAWVDGAGRMALPRGAKEIRITAGNDLPRDAVLQVEAFEIAAR